MYSILNLCMYICHNFKIDIAIMEAVVTMVALATGDSRDCNTTGDSNGTVIEPVTRQQYICWQ